MLLANVEANEARKMLQDADGFIRKALKIKK
jgi:N-acetylmuramic acid 6-phosphate (MurNAc-6-P) etherase